MNTRPDESVRAFRGALPTEAVCRRAGLKDYSQINVQDVWYKSVNFGAENSQEVLFLRGQAKPELRTPRGQFCTR